MAQMDGRAVPVAMVGMGVVTPGANSPEELWQLLNGDRHVFGEPARFDMSSFYSADPADEDRSYAPRAGFVRDFVPHPALRAELEDRAVTATEPTALWLRHSLYSALDGVRRTPGDRWFAAFGYTADGSAELEGRMVADGYSERLAAAGGATGPYTAGQWRERLAVRYPDPGGSAEDSLPHRVGRTAVNGLLPCDTELLMVDAACSSSLYALDLTVKALREGSCSVAVCGGSFAVVPRLHVLFSKINGLSRSGSVRSFDRRADGVLFTDGAGAVVLKMLERAERDGDKVLGIVEGIGLSCDGKGKAIYAPNPRGQQAAIRRAHKQAGGRPSGVDWIIAHATGTPAGDSIEAQALADASPDPEGTLLTSNKSLLGHTGWSAGVVSLVQALLGFKHGGVPAQRYFDEAITAIAEGPFLVPTLPHRGPGPQRVAISAFGFGGTNAHLLVRAPDGRQSERSSPAAGTAAAPACEGAAEPLVLVGWATDLPGIPDGTKAVAAWLRGEAAPPTHSWGDAYPAPSFRVAPLSPPARRSTDRTQLMLLSAASRLPTGVLELCALLRERTGVVAAHTGPTRHSVHYALRSHSENVRAALGADLKALEAWEAVQQEVQGLVPAGDDMTMPGIMPNVIPARLAAVADYRGLNLAVDSGPDSGLDALRTAERFLRHDTLDVVLVAGVNGNSTPEYRRLLTSAGDRALAEGAFVLALCRADTAREAGLEQLAVLRTETGPGLKAGHRAHTGADSPPLSGGRITYPGSDPLIGVLSAALSGSGRTCILPTLPGGTSVLVSVPPTVPDPSNGMSDNRQGL
ncbi:beta-ketoacyl synthase N-terminal-like domain-containing protein [Streptomyces griseus]|uniref:beta-ketoacyl synthase N-terminal-like domain-containing protein n=1 Tax=Streptomyces griseus TaxID=1911 RepID=UPI000996E9F4|nr:beta-ketoacyl synthase N-terminal-like domain-containing protein [Streptomyces griseus]